LAELCGEPVPHVEVRASLAEALAATEADVAFHAVASRVRDVEGQIQALLEAGLDVVTSAEEMIWPYAGARDVAERIDECARQCGRSVVAAGVNPGVLMDRLPVYLSSLCVHVEAVEVYRLVDLSKRRPALRKKMGVGRPRAEVEAAAEAGTIGHVGLRESLYYLAAGLGWKLDSVRERIEPIVAREALEKGGELVRPGEVLGLDHSVEATALGGGRARLHLVMRLDATDPVDEIRLEGEPPLHVRFVGGVDGDVATAATVINAASFARGAAPGLITRIAMPAIG
ncbi:MAG: hypothetical protein D6815_07255, partial [Candidatus Dadabacteria bacterium]